MSENQNNYNHDEDINMLDNNIPCEFCNQLVDFEEYGEHVENCLAIHDARIRRFNAMNNLINILNPINFEYYNTNDNSERELSDEEIERINNTDEEVQSPSEDSNDSSNEISSNSSNQEQDQDNNQEDNQEDNDNSRYYTFNRNDIPFTLLSNSSSLLLNARLNINRFLNSNVNLNNINLDNINNLSEYDFNLLIQQLLGGNVKVGVKDIDKYIKIIDNDDLNEDDNCCICLENLKELYDDNKLNDNINKKINIPVKTICNHIYCRECITKWLTDNKSCPVCNNRFENKNTDNNENDNNDNNDNNNDNENDNDMNDENNENDDRNNDNIRRIISIEEFINMNNVD